MAGIIFCIASNSCLGAVELCFGNSLHSDHMLGPVPKKEKQTMLRFIHKNNAEKC